MNRPILYFFFIPFVLVSFVLYIRILFLAWTKSNSMKFNSFFYKITRSQAFLDISCIIVYYLSEVPQDFTSLYHLLLDLNGTIVPQLIYCHVYLCILGQVYGVTLISVNRMLLICLPTFSIIKTMESLPFHISLLLHICPPLAYTLFMLFGQKPSTYKYIDDYIGVTKMSEDWEVRLNSDVASFTCLTGAVICAFCYSFIFIILRKRPIRSIRKELPLLITSFILFLALCLLFMFFFVNRFFVAIDWATLFFLRKHFYLFLFTLCLVNPWCLVLTSSSMRKTVLGKTMLKRLTMSSNVPSVGSQQLPSTNNVVINLPHS